MTDDPRTAEERIEDLYNQTQIVGSPRGCVSHRIAFTRAVVGECIGLAEQSDDAWRAGLRLLSIDQKKAISQERQHIVRVIRAHFGLEDADGK